MSYAFSTHPTGLSGLPLTFGSYDSLKFKVVPKDAVVLDLTKAPLGGLQGNLPAWLRHVAASDERVEGEWGRPRRSAVRWLADEIEEQARKPEPPEPGTWGVVRDKNGHDWVRVGAVQLSSYPWFNTETERRSDYKNIDVESVIRQ